MSMGIQTQSNEQISGDQTRRLIRGPVLSVTRVERDIAEPLLPDLSRIARDGFGTAITDEDVRAHVLGTDALYLLAHEKDLVGFAAYDLRRACGAKVLYLGGIVVERSAQRLGLFRLANEHALREHKPDYFALRTQNPVVYGAAKKLLRTIYPDGQEPPTGIVGIAALFGGPSFNRRTFVSRGLYGGTLYDRIPDYPGAKSFFDETLRMDYSAGDSVVVVGEPR